MKLEGGHGEVLHIASWASNFTVWDNGNNHEFDVSLVEAACKFSDVLSGE
jgi:hypothetical protein